MYHEESLNEMAFRFPELSKKEIEQQGYLKAFNMMQEGEHDEFRLLASAERLKTYTESFCKELRKHVNLTEKTYKAHGVEFSTMNTGDRYDFEQDDVYKTLKEQLKEREDLLKLALKSKNQIFDADGVEVPRVGIKTYGSEVIKLKF